MSAITGSYPYLQKLLALESQAAIISLATASQLVRRFLPLQEGLPFLASMPDQGLAVFLERGIRRGFAIGFNPDSNLKPAGSNMSFVRDNPKVVSSYIAEEVVAGRLCPYSVKHLSPIGLIPKKNRPCCFCMIVDLSSPRGYSVNYGIPPEFCSFHYASVANAAHRMLHYGQAALMAKVDLKSACRMVPVRPEDSHLLGI
uniref:Uncharacterized protein n=1 Tax=Amphimedon queenslandica TaxID=400682 RepID=A0A1X7USG2_AMPQE